MAEKKVVVVTGASSGIGLATVKALLQSQEGYHVLLGGLSLDDAVQAVQAISTEATTNSVEAFEVDVSDDESIRAAYEAIASKHPRVDCLINNAGVSFDTQVAKGNMSAREAWRRAWDVNVTGAYIMTSTFLQLLLKSQDPRLLFIASGLSSLQEAYDPKNPSTVVPPSGLPKPPQPFASYRCTKAGLNMMMLGWAHVLKSDGVKVFCVAPGIIATSLGGNDEFLKKIGGKDPSIGGGVILNVIEGKRDADAAHVVREYSTPIQPW